MGFESSPIQQDTEPGNDGTISKSSKGGPDEYPPMALAEWLAFGLFAVVLLGSSLGAVLMRDVWHSALLLGVALVGVAAHYVMLQAEFLAAIQILVYVGGVLILVTFAVMLTGSESDGATASSTRLETEGNQ